MKNGLRYILLLLFLSTSVIAAKSGHIRLLAVIEDESGKSTLEGSVADLYLEILPGSGRVFLDTYPLTKLDTQISTRFAKEIACDYIDADCARYDFVYTIRSGSAIIGGPSAGAAITVLTIALLQGFEVNESVAVTGTINSGGIVGNVGGVKQKIEAAAKNGITMTLIPVGERYAIEEIEDDWKPVNESSNLTIASVLNSSNFTELPELDLVEYGKNLSVQVVPVSDLADVIYAFTGKMSAQDVKEIEPDPEYVRTMRMLSDKLCKHSAQMQSTLNKKNLGVNTTIAEIYASAQNLSSQGMLAQAREDYYSSASFCFGSNIRYAQIEYMITDITYEDYVLLADDVAVEIKSYEKGIDAKEISTIADLEAFIVVKERIKESKEFLGYTQESLESNETNLNTTAYLLAYTRERLNSAYAWSEFFGLSGKEFIFDNASMSTSCAVKIAEAEERVQFVKLLLPDFFKDKDLSQAYAHQKTQNYALCLFTASKVKAEVDVVLSASGVESTKLQELMASKLLAVRRNIARQMEKDIFPILGYSYYEYGQSLQESDPYSALLYLEYALELSNMDLYFKAQTSTFDEVWHRVDLSRLVLVGISLLLGIVIGVLCTLTVLRGSSDRHTTPRRKKRAVLRQ